MNKNSKARRFVVCIRNEGYEVSLEVRKIYRVLPDAAAERHHLLRVVDESADDYLYPEDFFLPIGLPKPVEKALLAVS
jgi:hypothetical protein